jgi:hypothetical protein
LEDLLTQLQELPSFGGNVRDCRVERWSELCGGGQPPRGTTHRFSFLEGCPPNASSSLNQKDYIADDPGPLGRARACCSKEPLQLGIVFDYLPRYGFSEPRELVESIIRNSADCRSGAHWIVDSRKLRPCI